MAEVSLPDLSLRWAQGGDILKPSDAKIQQGWQVEIPPRQWFNWLDNRQDEAIAHIAQHGIAVWSDKIEYQANKSFTQGSDGIIYKALTTHTNINPVGGVPGNWQSAFLTADQVVQVASAAQSRAMTANNVYISPLQLSNAFTGTNQQLGTNGFQVLPGGLLLQWGSFTTSAVSDSTVSYPRTFSSLYSLQATANATGNIANEYTVAQPFSVTNTGFACRALLNGDSNPVGQRSAATVYWFAIGIAS